MPWDPQPFLQSLWSIVRRRLISYHIKLLNPRTRIAIPVNWITSVKFESNASINWGNMGAKAKGPIAWAKDTAVAHVKVENFQNVLQFYEDSLSLAVQRLDWRFDNLDIRTNGSWGSLDGWGTSTRSDFADDLTKWCVPTSVMTSVPGTIWTLSSCSSWCRVWDQKISNALSLGYLDIHFHHNSSPCWAMMALWSLVLYIYI